MGEDVVEGFLGGNLAFAGYLSKVGEDEAEVFGNEVTCKAGFETVEDALEIHVSVGERFVVTSIGNDDVVGGEGGDVGGLVDGGLEGGDALAVLGGDGDDGVGCDFIATYGMEVGLVEDGDEDAT